MATQFWNEAQAQIDPIYQGSEAAIQAQIPAVQQLYQTLFQGLEGQRATETQNIVESASQRGVLRSSLPVDLQTTLGQALLAERGKLSAQQAQDISGVNERLGNLRIQKAGAIQSLADSLYQRDLKERELQLQRDLAEREFQMKMQAAASGGGGGGGGGGGSSLKQQQAAGKAYIAQNLAKNAGRDGYVSRQTFATALNDWNALGGSTRTFWQTYGRYANPKTKAQYAGYGQR